MKAVLRNYRQSPRKVRLLADAIRGKRVRDARVLLQVADKHAAKAVQKVLNSAIANAKENAGVANPDDLIVDEARVDEGVTLKRYLPRAFGRATLLHKRTSHIAILLAERVDAARANQKTETPTTEEKAEAKPAGKSAKKEASSKKETTEPKEKVDKSPKANKAKS